MRNAKRALLRRHAARSRNHSLRLEPLEPRMLLSGGSLGTLLADGLTAGADSKDIWMSPSGAAGQSQSQTESYAPGAEGAVDFLGEFTYDTRADGMPILHSLPGAPASIYLDFDGYTPEGWLPFDQDGDGSTFNETEQATIVETWRQIDAYYSMFDVDVTTIEPDVYSQPTSWHVITPSYKSGGLAWDVFPNYTPGSMVDGDWSPFSYQVAIAHEVGHTFGCGHISKFDTSGNNIQEYAVFDDPLRGSTMGGSGRVINKWYLWHAAPWHNPGGPSYLQDDVGYIADLIDDYAYSGYTGDGFRTDDYAGTLAAATPLAVEDTTQWTTGIIERLADADAFSFSVDATGNYAVAATREDPGGVDLKISVYDSAGTLLAAADDDPRDEPKSLANDEFLTLDLDATGTYYVVVESHGNYADLGRYNLRVDPLPSGWTVDNVGLNARPGYVAYDAATSEYEVAGSGYFIYPSTSSSIGGNNDSFQYLYQTLEGDGEIIARVASMSSSENPKAGIMIRESLDSDSASASLCLTGSNRAYFYYRDTAGGGTTNATRFATTYSQLKLTRSGDTFSAFVSYNGGSSWQQVGSDQTIDMGQTVYIGLVSTAAADDLGNPSAPTNQPLNVATFRNVNLSGNLNPTPVLNGLTPPSNLTVTGRTSSSIGLSWTDTSGETGYVVERSTDGVHYLPIGTTGADTTSYTDAALVDDDSGLPLYQTYFYRVRAEAADETVSDPSSVVSDVPRAGPVSDLVLNSISPSEVVLDWQDASGENGYRVQRSLTGTGAWVTVGILGENVPSYTNSGLGGGTYYYRVVTRDAAGDAAVSDVVTRLGGMEFTAKEPYRMSLQWDAVPWATSYRVERSTNGATFYTLTSSCQESSFTDPNVSPLGEYYYRVTALGDGQTSTGPVIFAAAPAASALPTPWQTVDIGGVGGTGAARYSNGTFVLVGAGAEILGTNDEFRYVYKQTSGDFSFTARVTSVEETNYWSKAGIMVRETTATNSKHAMIYISPHLAVFQWRSNTGNYVYDTYGPSETAPYYVRLTRSGSTFTGQISPDGNAWTTVDSRSISMSSSVMVGFALCSRDDNLLNTSTFTMTPDANVAPTVAMAAAAAANPVTGATVGLSVRGNDDHGEPNLTYTWTATSLPPGASQPTYDVNVENAAKNTTATFSKAGDYTLRVTITDTSGLSTTSSVDVTVESTLTSISVVPSVASVIIGATQQFTATGLDQFGAVLSTQPTFAWSAAMGQITADGLYTAPDAATADTVTATVGAIDGTAQLAVTPSPLPPPWSASDVGAVAASGTAGYSAGSIIVEGSGNNIFNTADEFHYVYQTLAGDGRITARVESIEPTGEFAKAGVMMRETLSTGSRNVATLLTPAGGARVQYRDETDGSTAKPAENLSVEAPYWVRLTRSGDVYRCEISSDGAAWATLGDVALAMGSTVYVGLPVTSYDDGTLCTAVFTDVSVESHAVRLPGDADFSGTVDQADAAIMSAHWGTTAGALWIDGDFNDDGRVDLADASILAANWGATVPESSTGPFAQPFVGPVRLEPGLQTRQLLLPTQRAEGGTLLDNLAQAATRQNTSAHDAVLAEQYGPSAEQSTIGPRRLAWSHTVARRGVERSRILPSPTLVDDLLLADDDVD